MCNEDEYRDEQDENGKRSPAIEYGYETVDNYDYFYRFLSQMYGGEIV